MKTSIVLGIVLAGQLICEAQIKVDNLLCENLSNPIGIDVKAPRFTWQLISDKRNVIQTAYEIRVSESESSFEKKGSPYWASAKILSDSSVQVAYKGPALKSDTRYYWQVKIWDNKGEESKWSEPGFWQMGLLDSAEWKAEWIAQGFSQDSTRPSPMFRKTFTLDKEIKSATAYVTSLGLYTSYLNGQRIGNAYFTPGWTDYNTRLQYQAYDVTALIQKGQNVAGVVLGDGWYKRFYLGKDPRLCLRFQLAIHYSDGTTGLVLSDSSWKSTTGIVRRSEIFDGGIFDARNKKEGWTTPKFDEGRWSGVAVKDSLRYKLVAAYSEPITEHERFQPARIFTTPKGERVIDFGQMLAGWLRFKVSGKSGDTVKVFHADVLDKEGNFYTAGLWGEKENRYILNGEGGEICEPEFTYQGFRYVKLEGYPGELKPENFTAIALYSDMKETGNFSCSDSLVNQLQHNIQWTEKEYFF